MTNARHANRSIPALIITAGAVALLVSSPAIASSPTGGGDVRILDARARWETLNQIRADKFDLILPGAMRDNLFAFEFIIHNAIPDGTRVRINLEDNAIVTVHGVEWLYPPNSRILEIR